MKKSYSVLVAMSGFKGTLSNQEACAAVGEALSALKIPHRLLPIGDGGRGTWLGVQSAMGGEVAEFPGTDPLGRKVSAKVLLIPNKEMPTIAYVESPETCGHHLLKPEERDAMRASSQGLGEVLSEVVTKHPQLSKIFVGLGDSAISDAGMGMLCGLGYTFQDQGGQTVWANANGLRQIRSFTPPKKFSFGKTRIIVLCDVMNPLCGPMGSARVFGPQKGASKEQVHLLEQGMENFADLVAKSTGRKLRDEPMTGSAGGLASAFRGFLDAQLVQGARYLLDWIGFDQILSDFDVLVTGEGKTDQQTLSGKAPWVSIERATEKGKGAIVISGTLGAGYEILKQGRNILGVFECGNFPNAKDALKNQAHQVFSELNAENLS